MVQGANGDTPRVGVPKRLNDVHWQHLDVTGAARAALLGSRPIRRSRLPRRAIRRGCTGRRGVAN
ncbi:hypothetical protein BX592_106149 [Paraburkholderia rhizosphaerae]|uniref:Uncharacterized protein n=1 Tax=Paraburkholderia rhizosphaerae TaxID=480658 RepID=A0A4R8LVK2_9BURK|nr:hypothetical protein BX592_106149 [Paraburkholderia rhizosphaerae]